MKPESDAVKRRLETIRTRYGETYFRDLGKHFAKEKLEADPDYYARMGERGGMVGGNATLARYGIDHFVGIGQKSAQKRKARAQGHPDEEWED